MTNNKCNKYKIRIIAESFILFCFSIVIALTIETCFKFDFLKIGGLSFNFLGAFVLAIPLLRFEEQFHNEKDRLIDCEERGENYLYTTKRRINNVKLAFKGLALIMSGFILQILAMFLDK